jgi:hypothetical protein
MFKPGSTSKWRRWVPLMGILYAGTIIIGVLAVSPFGCWLLPPSISGRVIKLYSEPNAVFFKVVGNSRCVITSEGLFPPWFKAVRITFKSRDAFFTSTQTIYQLERDFTTDYDGVTAGVIKVDRAKHTALFEFEFDNEHTYNYFVNGSFDLRTIEPAS